MLTTFEFRCLLSSHNTHCNCYYLSRLPLSRLHQLQESQFFLRKKKSMDTVYSSRPLTKLFLYFQVEGVTVILNQARIIEGQNDTIPFIVHCKQFPFVIAQGFKAKFSCSSVVISVVRKKLGLASLRDIGVFYGIYVQTERWLLLQS